MRAFALAPNDVSEDSALGRILCHDIVAVGEGGRAKLSKGRILGSADIPLLRTFPGEIHLLEVGPGDVHEDVASVRLARAVSGDGIAISGPVESQTHLRAAYRGVVRIRPDALYAINCLPDMAVYTLFDGQPVDTGKMVAASKVIPLAVPNAVLLQAEDIAAQARPIVEVVPFSRGKIGVLVRDRIAGKGRDAFESAIRMKTGWFGSQVDDIRYVPDIVESIAGAIEDFIASGAVLILAAGVNSTDPLDLTLQALERVGARTEKRGVPAHPGSTCWLAYVGQVPIFGLALCGMFSQTTVLDLLLPRFLSGREVRADEIASLGHGGVLGKDMAFRFPEYARTGS